jgi:hypothetical protein
MTTAGVDSRGSAAGTGMGAVVRPPSERCSTHEYRCPDACRGVKLIGGGRALGQCSGDCRFDLSIDALTDLAYEQCLAMKLTLSVQRNDAPAVMPGPYRTVIASAYLSESAWEQLASIAGALDVPLELPSNCPDCAGEDEAWITLDGEEAPTELHYQRARPPPPLGAADAFIQALIDQLLTCEGDLIDQCADIGACRFTYTNTERGTWRGCAVPLHDPSPCRSAVRCLCAGDVLPDDGGASSVEACEASWLAPRGAPTFADFCVASAPSATRNLIDAMSAFAALYQGEVTMVDGLCGMIPANY